MFKFIFSEYLSEI